MRAYMRNKATGEVRDVEADSQEYRKLQSEVTPHGLPMWEQTHFPHVDGIQQRAEADELLEEDMGYEQQNELRYEALKLNAEGVAPEKNPHLALTPAEVELGLTPEQKLKDLEQMWADRTGRHEVLNKAAEKVAGKKPQKPTQKPQGQSARAGGSDVREEAPLVAGGE